MKKLFQLIHTSSHRTGQWHYSISRIVAFSLAFQLLISQTMVAYAETPGLSDTGSAAFSQNEPEIPGIPEVGDNMGEVVAAGDFNGDTFADLAIGNPGEAISTTTRAGSVTILYGSANGLITQSSEGFSQNTGDIPGASETDDTMGDALATGDFNGDSFTDLAVGVPGEDIGDTANAGSVIIIYGSVDGLRDQGSVAFSQDTGAIPGAAEANDSMGAALATGDFNGDSFTDLAIGCPGEAIGTTGLAGSVIVLYGSTNGLSDQNSIGFSQNTGDIPGIAEASDRMGSALVAGDFNHDSFIDLAIGNPGEALGTETLAGSVTILYGSANGLRDQGSVAFSQDTGNVPGAAEAGDRMGAALASGDYNGDGHADLAVGVPSEDLGAANRAGSVIILYGSATGISDNGSAAFTQDTGDIPGVPETGDNIGAALTAGDFNRDSFVDLAVGIPNENIGTTEDAGGVLILYGSANGLSDKSSEDFSQNTGDVPGVPEEGDTMGKAVTSGDFNGDSFIDLAVGVPGESIANAADAGSVLVLYAQSVKVFLPLITR